MRPFLLILPMIALLPACSRGAPPPAKEELALYSGPGRDRLCVAGRRAGFIVYGQGDRNCSVRGSVERSAAGMTIVPDGDPGCHILASAKGTAITLGPLAASCSFYCAKGMDWGATRFERSSGAASDARDLAGDPLC